MNWITELTDRIQYLRLQVLDRVEEPWHSSLLNILFQLQLALQAFPSPRRTLADEHIAEAEARLSALIASLRRRFFPHRPPDASEATILARKSDLIRLLDLQPPGDPLIDSVVDLACTAVENCDDLTHYVLISGPLDLYYCMRKVDSYRVHERLYSSRDGGAISHLLELLFGCDGVADLVQELKQTSRDLHAARQIGGTFHRDQTDLPSQGDLPETSEEELTSEVLTLEERREIASIEQEFREIAMFVGGLGTATAASGTSVEHIPSKIGPQPTIPEVWRSSRGTRPPIRSTILLSILCGLLVFAAPVRLVASWSSLAVTPSPPEAATRGVETNTATPGTIPRPSFVPPMTTPRPFLSPTTELLRSPTVPPPTPTWTAPELRVVAQGFGQDQQEVGYAFVVKNNSRLMITSQTHYMVTAFDAAGTIVATAWGEIGVILPVQQLGIAGTFLDPGDTRVARIEVKLGTVAFQSPVTNEPQLLSTDSLTLRPDTVSPSVSGVVINLESFAFESVAVNVIAYDETGKIVGGGATTIGPLPSNTQTPVDVQTTTSRVPSRVDLYAAPLSLPPIH